MNAGEVTSLFGLIAWVAFLTLVGFAIVLYWKNQGRR